jgi:hypothetical protein
VCGQLEKSSREKKSALEKGGLCPENAHSFLPVIGDGLINKANLAGAAMCNDPIEN